MRIVIDILVILSILFALAGVVGIIRMPDSFCRMQSSTNISTFGVLGVIIAGILYSIIYLGDVSMAVKLGVLGVFYIVTSPISGHAIAKAAYRHGVKPSKQTVVDKLKEDMKNE